ncbi:hypothetical protein GCM10020331_034630 [Ectobacillus funiculus]
MYPIGTLAKVKQMLKLPNNTVRVLVEGLHRAEIQELLEEEDVTNAAVRILEDEEAGDLEEKALMRSLLEQFDEYIKLSKKISNEVFATVADIDEPGRLADLISSHLPLKTKEKQEILAITNIKERLQTLIALIQDEQELLNLEKKIGQRVKRSMERTQREYFSS